MFCRLGNAKCPGVSFRNSSLDIISSFVILPVCVYSRDSGQVFSPFVLLSMKIFAACANFRPLVFRPAVGGTFGVRTRPRVAFGRRRPLIEKRCEDASHSQSTSRHGGQAVQDAVDAF
jgi:hypothetical protein